MLYSIKSDQNSLFLVDYIPSDYAHLSKVLSKRGTPPPINIIQQQIKEQIKLEEKHKTDAKNKDKKDKKASSDINLNYDRLDNAINKSAGKLAAFTGLSDKSNLNIQNDKDRTSYVPRYEDFKILKVLGQGSFGKVLLAQWKKSDKVVAIKALRKDATIDNNDVTATIVERDILALGNDKQSCSFLASLRLFS